MRLKFGMFDLSGEFCQEGRNLFFYLFDSSAEIFFSEAAPSARALMRRAPVIARRSGTSLSVIRQPKNLAIKIC
jgi:hypothetical protein